MRGMKEEGRRECELCKGEASLYCEADAAFLCWSCDAGVHGANFLVARHVRTIVCAGCRSIAAGNFSGVGSSPIRELCRSCSHDLPSITATASSSSSSCASIAEAASSAAVAADVAPPPPPLCNGEASLDCEADTAFLFCSCDASVHDANLLVTRHVRAIACAVCRSIAAGNFSGAGSSPIRALCLSCSPDLPSTTATASSSSSCVSIAKPSSSVALAADVALPPQRRRRVVMAEKVEAEIHRWCEMVGTGSTRRCAGVALRMLADCGRGLAGVPIRVAMAATVWFVVKREENGGGGALRRLVACAGVRARAVLQAEMRLARAVARGEDLEEGWGECP